MGKIVGDQRLSSDRTMGRPRFQLTSMISAGIATSSLWMNTQSSATVILVAPEGGCPYQHCSIQAGVAAASSGDTILAAAGTYIENVIVDKAVTIRSIAGSGQTLVDGDDTDWVFDFTGSSDGSQLIGFAVQGGNPGGIRCSGTNVTLRRLIVGNEDRPNHGSPSSYGMYIGSSGAVVDSCTIQETGLSETNNLAYGIYGTNNSAVTVSHCSILNNNGGTYNGMGIYAEEALSGRTALIDSMRTRQMGFVMNSSENTSERLDVGRRTPTTALLIRDCNLLSNNWSNIQVKNFSLNGDTLKIVRCLVQNDSDVDQDDAMVEIVDTEARIEQCTLTGGYTRAIQIQDDVLSTEETVIIRECEIYENKSATDGGAGIMASWPSIVHIEGNEIHHNEGRNGGSGILILGAECQIIGNDVHDNIDPDSFNPPHAIQVGPNPFFQAQSNIVTVFGNTVTNNGAETQVDGIQVVAAVSSPVEIQIAGNTVVGNSGSGVSVRGLGKSFHDLTIDGNVILNNGTALPNNVPGGGVSLFGRFSPASFTDNVIAKNEATLGGGIALTSLEFPVSIDNCTLAFNESENTGTAVRAVGESTDFELHNTIIFDNSGLGIGALDPVACLFGAEVADASCLLVYANDVNYSGCLEPFGELPDMLEEDPLFCDAANDDYTLRSDSPCLAKNSPSGCGLIGALGEGCEKLIGRDATPGASVSVALGGNRIALDIMVVKDDKASVDLYDVSGRLAMRVPDIHLRSGPNRVVLDSRILASGLYFVRVLTNSGTHSSKVVVVK